MKRIINLSLLLLALLLPATASAYDFEVDGIYYNINGDNQVTVTDADGNWQTPDYFGDVTIPETVTHNGTTYSVTTIGGTAFYGCSELTSITIPNSVTSIGNAAFFDCSGLTSINIPNSVTTIGEGTFQGCSGLTSVTIPNSVTSIGSFAFSRCSGLTNANIGNSVSAIEWCTFEYCSNLASVTIGNSVTSIGLSAFIGCSSLTRVTIPNSVTYIGGGAFRDCSSLTSIDIPNSVTTIDGDETFGNCSSLTSIFIPNSVTYISGYGTLNGCSNLTSIVIDSGNTKYDSRDNCNAIIETSSNTLIAGCKNSTIPNSVTAIGDYAFLNCSGLTSITIPNSVTSINWSAFYGCSGLTSITVAYDNMKYDSRDNCNAIIETSSNTLIAGCKNTTIPNSVTSIGNIAFDGCSGLTSITIPNSVTSIGSSAFSYCSGLTSIDIPNSVTSIGYGAFSQCSGLKDIYCYIENPLQVTMSSNVFSLSTSNYSERTLHVPASSLEAYQADTKWSQYFGSIVEMEIEPEAANHITLPDTTVMNGDIIALPVAMTNDATLMAFQTDIFLPEGFTIVTDEEDEYIITPSERLSSDHVIMSDNANNGSVRVICYTPNSQPISGNDGDLFYIHVQVPDDAEGPYTINLRNTLLTTVDYNEISAPDTSAVIEVIQFIPGDVNDSRTVNVTDIVVAAQYILDRNPNPFVFEAADMNGDGNVTVTDIMLIAYLINHPTMNAPKRMPALMDGNDRMSGEGVSLMAGETRTVSIVLDNEMDYTAFQMDLTLPEGLTASNYQLTDRAGNHAFDVSTLSNGDIRALCYSPAIEVIDGNSGALLTFDVTATDAIEGDITVDGIELVTTDCQSVLLNGFAIGVNTTTSVNEVANGKTVARVDYFNLAGQRIDRPQSGVTLVVTTYTDGTRTTTKLHRK